MEPLSPRFVETSEHVPTAFSQRTTDKSNINEDNQKLNFFIGFDRLALLPGHPVTGVIYISAKEKVIIKKIGINWFGLESVSWFQGYLQDENCQNTRWWVKDRTILFPDTESNLAKEFEPGTYKYPFSWTLPTEIPGSFEEERSWTKVVFDDTFGLKTLDTNRGSFIRYTCTAFITEQKHLDTDQDNLMITVEPDVKTHVVSKDFRVSEVYDPQIVLLPTRVKSAEELFLGDPLKVVLSVANDGNILIKAPLYLRIDVHNFTSFSVSSMKLSILEKKNFTCVGPEGSVEVFSRTTDIYSVDVKDSGIPSKGGKFEKPVKLTPPKEDEWGPSVLGGANITLTHEVCLQVYIMATVVEISQPIRILEYSSFISKIFPKHIPHNIDPPNFDEIFRSRGPIAITGKSLEDLEAMDSAPKGEATINQDWSSTFSGWFGSSGGDAQKPEEPTTVPTPTQSNVSWFANWFSSQNTVEEKYGQDGADEGVGSLVL